MPAGQTRDQLQNRMFWDIFRLPPEAQGKPEQLYAATVQEGKEFTIAAVGAAQNNTVSLSFRCGPCVCVAALHRQQEPAALPILLCLLRDADICLPCFTFVIVHMRDLVWGKSPKASQLSFADSSFPVCLTAAALCHSPMDLPALLRQ